MSTPNEMGMKGLEHTILFDGYLNPRAGGASAYLWNLREGLARIGHEDRVLFSTRTSKSFAMKLRGQRFVADVRQRIASHVIGAYKDFWKESRRVKHCQDGRWTAGTDLLIQSLDLSRIRTLHIHDTVQMAGVHHALEIRGHRKRIKLVLTSHPPELPGVERATEYRDRGVSESLVSRFEDMHVSVDERAFSVADALVFPSKEAAEPYLGRFGSIIKDKEVRYVLTGVPQVQAVAPISSSLEETLKGKFVICYLGRHNRIKGYDLLRDAAMLLLERHADVAVVIAGAVGSSQPLQHPRWIEVGWTPNPESLVSRCDVFALPNRATFFDLVLLEVMSLGKPVIASRTGGNKTVAAISRGIILFDGDFHDLAMKIEDLRRMSEEARRQLGKSNQDAYRENFTVERFAKSYLDVVNELRNA